MATLRLGGKIMKNWVVLFVRTGSEAQIVQILKEKLNAKKYLPFVPTKETPYRNKGVISKVRKPLFPGYVFVQAEIESDAIVDELAVASKDIKDFYSILYYGNNKKDVLVREEERLYWERLFDVDFCVVGSIGVLEGETVQISSGALVGLEGQIKKINRHQRVAVVEMKMMGTTRQVMLMLEILEKVK